MSETLAQAIGRLLTSSQEIPISAVLGRSLTAAERSALLELFPDDIPEQICMYRVLRELKK